MQHPGCGQETAWPPPSRLVREDLPPCRAEVSHSHAAKDKGLVAFCSPLFRTFYNSYLKTFPTWHKVLCFPHQQRALVPFSSSHFRFIPSRSCLYSTGVGHLLVSLPMSGIHRQQTGTGTAGREGRTQGQPAAAPGPALRGVSAQRRALQPEGAMLGRQGVQTMDVQVTRGRGRTSQAEKGVLGGSGAGDISNRRNNKRKEIKAERHVCGNGGVAIPQGKGARGKFRRTAKDQTLKNKLVALNLNLES